MDPNGKMEQSQKSLARSETNIYITMEKVCVEMRNYSSFHEEDANGQKIKIYHRYQNRPEEHGPLKLKNFAWSVVEQDQLRLACDAILSEVEEELVAA